MQGALACLQVRRVWPSRPQRRQELRARFVTDLSARFPTEDKGELGWILSVAITRDRRARTLSMSQELYVVDLITKYGISGVFSRKWWGFFPYAFLCILLHSNAFSTISLHSIRLHSSHAAYKCILMHLNVFM